MSSKIRIALIGAGQVSDFHHKPAIDLDPRCELAAVCDPNPALLEQRRGEWGDASYVTDYQAVCDDPNVDAAVVATPNFTHREITEALCAAGKHVMCEKPLALTAEDAAAMAAAADAAGVVHMTAFTYRFAPSMRYVKHLTETGALGTPYHFRSQRWLDWGEKSWGWRQYKKTAGAGDLYDMTIHRIDFAEDLMGKLASVCGSVARFKERTVGPDGSPVAPSEVDDWSSLIGRFKAGGTGVWEGSVLMKGHHNDGVGYEWAEVNGSTGSAAYQLTDPSKVLVGTGGKDLEHVAVPEEFLKHPDSPRDPHAGKPSTVFRYDLVTEFVSAIVQGRPALPDFHHGVRAQQIADAVLASSDGAGWVTV
ncbi:Gfo/Idh/MocA family protein [Alienimonas californiensis]|uniref:Putative oxidoreductase YcjS n=1 Tax=Alienimonas californiensis TaxID=2527989 RepID=A0A517PEQ8_9PLAN|nr:Gfo/Idh/MocA family oxidoreductase [Alienimonas californiensis]QDT17857.1 putative oxidoreductase YcjS [Alienimonas californiensis]